MICNSINDFRQPDCFDVDCIRFYNCRPHIISDGSVRNVLCQRIHLLSPLAYEMCMLPVGPELGNYCQLSMILGKKMRTIFYSRNSDLRFNGFESSFSSESSSY
ncbi:hypothetical protein CDAR_121 [Caerostris darwini]|uniref:Uncharacterized protein n=1 Tax=Caerostris darwini TaxID=1538125 RepID=A0AAV4TV72_9ARAC|nr:hypothetical protein CDAR_121 [Caerostris darwini]